MQLAFVADLRGTRSSSSSRLERCGAISSARRAIRDALAAPDDYRGSELIDGVGLFCVPGDRRALVRQRWSPWRRDGGASLCLVLAADSLGCADAAKPLRRGQEPQEQPCSKACHLREGVCVGVAWRAIDAERVCCESSRGTAVGVGAAIVLQLQLADLETL